MNKLVKKEDFVPDTLEKLAILDKVTEKLYKSGMFPHIKNGAQAFAIAEYGVELGFTPMVSMQHIAIVEGKLCIEVKLIIDKFVNNGGKITKIVSNKEECEVELEYKRSKIRSKYTMADAQRAGIAYKKEGGLKKAWRTNPEDMLYWRAVARGIRQIGGSLMTGAYTIEEMTEGEAITVEDLTLAQKKEKETPLGNGKITEAQLREKEEKIEVEAKEETEERDFSEEERRKLLIRKIHALLPEKGLVGEDGKPSEEYRNYIKTISGGIFDSSKDLPLEGLEVLLNWIYEIDSKEEVKKTEAIKEEIETIEYKDEEGLWIIASPVFTEEGDVDWQIEMKDIPKITKKALNLKVGISFEEFIKQKNGKNFVRFFVLKKIKSQNKELGKLIEIKLEE